MAEFHYNFTQCSDAEIGYMIHLGKQDWPDDPAEAQGRIEYLNDLYDELHKRWACADDSAAYHVQGLRR